VHEAARSQVGRYGGLANYLGMFRWAGFDDPAGADQDRLIDTLVVSGPDRAIVERLGRIIDEGAGEIIAHPLLVGADRDAELDRFLGLVARANRDAGVAV
jgi:hypothetical protein